MIDTATKSGNTPLHRAAAYGHDGLLGALLAAGGDIDSVNEDGATPLARAARWGHAAAARVLVRAGADSAIVDKAGRSPRTWAAAKGFADVAALLAEERPDLAALAPTANPERAAALAAGEGAGEPGEGGGGGGGGADGATEEEDGGYGPIRVEGWMAKQGHIIRNWKNRWFVLDGRRIFYFTKEGSVRPKGVIRMVAGTEVVVEERYAKPFCFTLMTPTKRYILQAATEDEMADWISSVQQNLDTVDPEDALATGADDGAEDD